MYFKPCRIENRIEGLAAPAPPLRQEGLRLFLDWAYRPTPSTPAHSVNRVERTWSW